MLQEAQGPRQFHNIDAVPEDECSLCNKETEQFDHACPSCGAITCSVCLPKYADPPPANANAAIEVPHIDTPAAGFVEKKCPKCGDCDRFADAIDAALAMKHTGEMAADLWSGAKEGNF